MNILGHLFLIFSVIALVLNVLSFVVLMRTKDLRQKRFYCLALYLSISDAVIGIETIAFYFLDILSNFTDSSSLTVCTILKTLIGGTMVFSLIQILLICLERLNATIKERSVCLEKITSDKSVLFCLIVSHVFPAIVPAIEISQGQTSCVIKSNPVRLIVFDVPVIILTAAIVFSYCLLITRIVLQYRKMQSLVVPAPNASTESVNHEAGESGKRMRMNIITLGIIIVIGLSSVIPRYVTSIMAIIEDNSPSTVQTLEIGNHFMIINAFLDPIVYILRIKTFRDKLRCAICVTSESNDHEMDG